MSNATAADLKRLPEYLRLPASYGRRFLHTLRAVLRLDHTVLVRNPGFLDAQVYAVGCTTAIVAAVKVFWPDDPIKTFDIPSALSSFQPLFDLIPLPLFTLAAGWLMFINLPMFLAARAFGYSPRLMRIYRATVYSLFTILVFTACLTIVRYFLYGIVGERFQHSIAMATDLIGYAVILYSCVISVKFLSIAHGIPWRKFLLINIGAIGLPLLLVDIFLPRNGIAQGIVYLFEPRPVRLFYATGSSMWPTIPEGAYVLTNRTVPASALRAGDIIAFNTRPPGLLENESIHIFRIIGLPGDAIQVIDGRIIRNRKALRREALGDRIEPEGDRTVPCYGEQNAGRTYEVCELVDSSMGDNTRVFQVPDAHFFVMGDNRDNANDSRFGAGFVPFEAVESKAYFILYPRTHGYLYKEPQAESR